MKRIYQ